MLFTFACGKHRRRNTNNGHQFRLQPLQSPAGGGCGRSRNVAAMSEVWETDRSASGIASRCAQGRRTNDGGCNCGTEQSRRRTAAAVERERIAANRSDRLYQPVEHSTASLAVAVADVGRTSQTAGERSGRRAIGPSRTGISLRCADVESLNRRSVKPFKR